MDQAPDIPAGAFVHTRQRFSGIEPYVTPVCSFCGAQGADSHHVRIGGTGKPAPNDIARLSDTARAYFHDWTRIRLEANKVLYRLWESHDGTEVRSQMLLPDLYREVMFRNLHDAINAAHMGKRRTLNKLQRKYYWFHMADDVGNWIRACPVCQRRKKGGRRAKANQCSTRTAQ